MDRTSRDKGVVFPAAARWCYVDLNSIKAKRLSRSFSKAIKNQETESEKPWAEDDAAPHTDDTESESGQVLETPLLLSGNGAAFLI